VGGLEKFYYSNNFCS